jgi:hypothetical protein
MTTTDRCSFPDCGDKRYAKDLCLAHYRRQRRGEPRVPVARRSAAEGRAVDGCDRPHRAGGLCTADYAHQQRGQDHRRSLLQRVLGRTHRGSRRWPPPRGRPTRSPQTPPLHGTFTGAPLPRVDPKRGCAVRWCGGRHYGRALCKRHLRMANAYGLDAEELVALLAATACASCGREWGKQPRPPGRDRPRPRHRKGPRGVVCGACNIGIGHFGDDPDRLVRAAANLRRVRLPDLAPLCVKKQRAGWF